MGSPSQFRYFGAVVNDDEVSGIVRENSTSFAVAVPPVHSVLG